MTLHVLIIACFGIAHNNFMKGYDPKAINKMHGGTSQHIISYLYCNIIAMQGHTWHLISN